MIQIAQGILNIFEINLVPVVYLHKFSRFLNESSWLNFYKNLEYGTNIFLQIRHATFLSNLINEVLIAKKRHLKIELKV